MTVKHQEEYVAPDEDMASVPMADAPMPNGIRMAQADRGQIIKCPGCGEILVVPDGGESGESIGYKHLYEMDASEAEQFLDAIEQTFEEAGRRNSKADMTLLQQVHDLTHKLGASCEGEK